MEEINKYLFNEIPLSLYEPQWGSSLATTIIELEKLRVKELGGPVPPHIFFQIKNIFQILESLGSARIEGNNTTLTEFVEKIIEDPTKTAKDESLKEIYNIEKAIDFIEKNVDKTTKIDRKLISEIHKIIVDGLSPAPTGEGSRYPGKLRPIDVIIQRANHVPPPHMRVPDFFEELITFIDRPKEAQYHLLIVALSHHRMAWIHPFDNGNGRLVRMFTYALLIKQGFQVKSGRILNPTAIFCMNRDKYYEMLALADTGEEEKTLQWCEYVLAGLQEEIEKIDRLLNISFMTENILLPALSFALERENITKQEYEILTFIAKNKGMSVKSADLEKIIGNESSVQRSRILRRLRDKKMLIPLKEKGRIYTLGFVNNFLLRGIVDILRKNNFIPNSLDTN